MAEQVPAILKEIDDLIRKAQNKNGSVPKQVRDDALMELAHRYRHLIKKFADMVHRKANRMPFEEFEHEALTIFIELVVDDYKLKEDGGAANFGPYITSKLYYRLLDKSQRAIRHYERMGVYDPQAENNREYQARGAQKHPAHLASNAAAHDIGIDSDGITRRAAIKQTPTEVFSATLASFSGSSAYDFVAIEERREEIVREATAIMETAKATLKTDEFEIFEMRYASGMTVKEIREIVNLPDDRIRLIAAQARKKVLMELGKQRVGKMLT